MNPDYILYTFFNVMDSVCPHNCDECVCAVFVPKAAPRCGLPSVVVNIGVFKTLSSWCF